MEIKRELWNSFNGYINLTVMRTVLVFFLLILLSAMAIPAHCYTGKKAHYLRGIGKRDNYEEFRTPGSVNRADGYVVYGADTIKGIISLDKFSVYLEQPINDQFSYYYYFEPADTRLTSVMVYNVDNKPLCLARVRKDDRKLLRLVHEGKLNIYDDRFAYIYTPNQVDKNLVVVACNGKVKELGSFFATGTKKSLVAYVNNVYHLSIDAHDISWKELLMTVDGLE